MFLLEADRPHWTFQGRRLRQVVKELSLADNNQRVVKVTVVAGYFHSNSLFDKEDCYV
jgi:hypothetical protein